MSRVRRLGAAVLIVMTGCAAPAPGLADRYDEEGPIVFVDGPDTSYGRQFEQLVEKWNRERGNDEEVEFVELSYTTDEQRAQLRARAQDLANADPDEYPSQCYDVMTMDVIWTAEFAERGYLVPLDAEEFRADRFLPQPLDAVTVDGQLWAIPMRTETGLLYYRKDLIDEPPRTWDELVELASTIPRGDMAGYVGQFARYEGLTVNALEAIWGAGGEVLAADGTVAVGSREAREGVRTLARGVDEGWIPREALGFNEERSREAFQQGDALFLRNWPYVYGLLDDENSPVAEKFGVAPLPGPSALGGWNLGISRCSTHRRTARDFIEFLTREDHQRLLLESAGVGPTIAGLYEDDELRRKVPYLDVLRESLRYARKRPTTPHYEDVSDAIQEHVGDALSQVDSADDRIADLAERLADIMRFR